MFRVTLAAAILFALGACSDDEPVAVATTAPAGTGAVTISYELMTAAQGKELIDSGVPLTIIDVRTPEEFAEGHIEGAVNSDIEGGAFSGYIATLDKNATYVVYCRSGRRSALAAQAMSSAGFTQVYDIGGLADWEAAGYPVVT